MQARKGISISIDILSGVDVGEHYL